MTTLDQPKIPSKWPIIICVVGIVFVLSILLSFAGRKSFDSLPSLFFRSQVKLPINETAAKLSTTSSFGIPVRLQIPDINIDALIIPVGITASGAMDVPKNPSDVAWFALGPQPGNIGSAVFSGHYGHWKTGDSSVFDDLNKLNPGDKIYVQDEKGTVATFVVRKSKIFDPQADASDIFVSSDGQAHLNLITCEGVWDSTQKTYSNRLVIFTDKEIATTTLLN